MPTYYPQWQGPKHSHTKRFKIKNIFEFENMETFKHCSNLHKKKKKINLTYKLCTLKTFATYNHILNPNLSK